MNLKKFNKKGNESYKILLQSSLNKNSLSNNDYEPFDILCKNKNLTDEVPNAKKIELKNFSNRFELGKYLNQVLSECKVSDFTQDECFWNWISCFYIRKILSSKGGKEIVRFQFTTSREGRRNLIRQPWLLYNINKDNSKFSLTSAVHIHSNECETYSSRPELYRNKVIGELIMDLYWDEKRGRVYENSTQHREKGIPGVLFPRLYKKILELSKVYDLWSIDKNSLKELIGDEFSYIKNESLKKEESKKSKNPVWTRNEQIIVLKNYFEYEDPIKFSKDKSKINEISKILNGLNEYDKSKRQDNFRSAEGVRRKILNFCSIDPRVEDEEGLEHHSKSDEKIFMEFFSNPEKINELPTMYKMITKKN